jgi:hypothetical protein
MRSIGFLLVLCGACGSSSDPTNNDFTNVDPTTRFNPWEINAVWSYQISQPNKAPATGRKRTITAVEDVGAPHPGTMAYKVHVELYAESKDLWERPEGDLDVAYKTAFYNTGGTLYETDTEQPYRVKLDESAAHTVTGATWTETFTETAVVVGQGPSSKTGHMTWKVINDAEPITVIAGTYTALHVQRTNVDKQPPEVVDYWYAKGVGRLKESGGNAVDELESFTPAP